jgi:nicotinate-nucleotide adenylyltransferase
MRLGIYGGTFDPVHYGHLLLAERCREQLQLDAVWFVPAYVSPHKQGREVVDANTRVEMLQLAIGGHEAFSVSRMEVDRGGLSYTVETIGAIRAERPDDELFILLGADALEDFPHWREPAKICELATLATVHRAGSSTPSFAPLADIVSAERLRTFQAAQVEMPLIGISSTEIRRRAAAGLSIRYLLPRGVEKLIETRGLYAAS